MDRNLARKNIRDGILIGVISIVMLALTFVAAAIYIS